MIMIIIGYYCESQNVRPLNSYIITATKGHQILCHPISSFYYHTRMYINIANICLYPLRIIIEVYLGLTDA